MTVLVAFVLIAAGGAGGSLVTHRLHQHRWEAARWDQIVVNAGRWRDTLARLDRAERLNRRLAQGRTR